MNRSSNHRWSTPPEQILRERREALHLTRREVGQRIGVVGETVRNWELGLTSPTLEHFTEWAVALDVTMALALTVVGPVPRSL